MTDTITLKNSVKESGITISFIARKMGCSRNRIYSILSGSECTISEVLKLQELLHLSDNERDLIFLQKRVSENNAS